MRKPRIFKLVRILDESGVSGIGHVLDGVLWPNKKVTVCWCAPDAPSSIVVYDSLQIFKQIHMKPHPTNKSKLIWQT